MLLMMIKSMMIKQDRCSRQWSSKTKKCAFPNIFTNDLHYFCKNDKTKLPYHNIKWNRNKMMFENSITNLYFIPVVKGTDTNRFWWKLNHNKKQLIVFSLIWNWSLVLHVFSKVLEQNIFLPILWAFGKKCLEMEDIFEKVLGHIYFESILDYR